MEGALVKILSLSIAAIYRGVTLSSFRDYSTYAGDYHRNHKVEIDSGGNLYISEDYRVQRFTILNGVQPHRRRK